jgi:hypothetical protein
MALREFRDGEGRAWTAWDVVPPRREQELPRSGRERRVTPTPGYRPERRVLRERRRLRTGPGLEGGWVCFQSDSEKRRLAPAPQGWEESPEDTLERLCREAQPARFNRDLELGAVAREPGNQGDEA